MTASDRDSDEPEPAPWLWAFFVLTIFLLVAVIGFTTWALVTPPRGIRGTVIVTQCTSVGKTSECDGSFRSDDGSLNLSDVQVGGDGQALLNSSVTGYYRRSLDTVYVHSTFATLMIGLSLAFVLSMLAFAQLMYRVWLPRRRRALRAARRAMP
ncbi:MAG TPA: hypothetical protein VJ914_40995 [Pseudonocardiaceae bacterium]|nr:hypothetical protein [Pseudonocardiaceae bacterium]